MMKIIKVKVWFAEESEHVIIAHKRIKMLGVTLYQKDFICPSGKALESGCYIPKL